MSLASRSVQTVARPPAELVPIIRQELSTNTDHYRTVGLLLLEAKEGLKHGEFKPWIKKNFKMSYDMAKEYMRYAKGGNSPSLRAARMDSSTRRNERRNGRERPEPEPEPEPERPPFVIHADPKVVRRKALAIEMIQTGFKKLAFERHPDRGGNAEDMAALSDARDWAVNFIEHPPLINLS